MSRDDAAAPTALTKKERTALLAIAKSEAIRDLIALRAHPRRN